MGRRYDPQHSFLGKKGRVYKCTTCGLPESRHQDFEHACTELRLYAENTGELYPEVRRLVGFLAREMKQFPKITDEVLLENNLIGWIQLLNLAATMYKKEIKLEEPIHFHSGVIEKVALEWAIDYLKRLRTGEQGLHD